MHNPSINLLCLVERQHWCGRCRCCHTTNSVVLLPDLTDARRHLFSSSPSPPPPPPRSSSFRNRFGGIFFLLYTDIFIILFFYFLFILLCVFTTTWCVLCGPAASSATITYTLFMIKNFSSCPCYTFPFYSFPSSYYYCAPLSLRAVWVPMCALHIFIHHKAGQAGRPG